VNRSDGVDNLGLDGLLMDNRDDGLMDMVMNVLSCHSGCRSLGVVGFVCRRMVLEVGHFSSEPLLGCRLVVMVELAMFSRKDVVGVLLWKTFLVGKRLYCGVVVMLMHFTVDSLSGFLVAVRLDGFMCHGGDDSFFDCGMVAPIAGEFLNGCFCCIHGECVWGILILGKR
jgi:hypothetical protein